jgi:tetratricopeptide (TPR) repeat protein
VLEILTAAVVQGQATGELFQMLHEAAKRDDRMADLALAYDAFSRDKKFRMLASAVQVELLIHAADFSTNYFGELEGAQGFLERVLALSPHHADAFAKLEGVLQERQDGLRLSELYISAASHRSEKPEQLVLLRAAVGLLSGYPEEEERALKLHQQILKLDPADAGARKAIGTRLVAAGRMGELAKLYEQALLADNPPSEEDALDIRGQLITIYTQKTNEPERGLPHAEEVLKTYPHNERARSVVEQLLGHKTLGARAAAALEGVYTRLGNHDEAARMLSIQIETQRGSRRLEAQKRLAGLLYQRRGDLPGSYSLYEGIVTVDPSDDEVRSRYRTIGTALDRRLDVTRVLTRAATGAKDPVVRAKIGADLGELLLEAGDSRRAKAAFQAVLDSGADDGASLRAARAMVDLNTEAHDLRGLAAVLNRLSDIEPEVNDRAAAAERLAQLYTTELADREGAVGAYRKLLDTPLEAQALPVLEELYEEAKDYDNLAFVLERRAAADPDREAARAIGFRAADLRSSQITDRAAALDGWRRFVTAYGPSRQAHERMLPLLEQEKRWEELASTLAAEASLASDAEKPPILTRLALVRLSRLNDGAGAIEAYKQALAADPTDKTSRTAVEKLLLSGDHRLAAAAVLEPLYRAEDSAEGLARVLDVRAALEPDFTARLVILREVADIVENRIGDPKRAINLAGQGLRQAAEAGLDDFSEWLAIIDRLAPTGTYAVRRAEVLSQALGNREIDRPALLDLARRTGEARAESGDVPGALAVYRRALLFEPSSSELLARLDALLAEQGTPEERLTLYRDALKGSADPARRQELLHSIGSIERRMGDFSAAAATYRKALEEDPAGLTAHEALLEIHAARSAWEPLYEELGRRLALTEGEEHAGIELRMAQVSVSSGRLDRAVTHYRELLAGGAPLSDSVLEAIEKLARGRGDVELRRMVLDRRVSTATEPSEEARWLEQLGTLQAEQMGDTTAAVASLLRAAELSESAEPERAKGLYERVLGLAPDERTAAQRLVQIYAQSSEWEKLPAIYDVLMRTSAGRGEASDWLIAFEPAAVRVRATDQFVRAADAMIEAQGDDALSAEQREAVVLCRARVVAADPDRKDEAAAAYRRMIEEPGAPQAAVSELESFVNANPERHEDRRWLFSYRLRSADDKSRVRVLLDWAAAEESAMSDPSAAAKLYEDVLAIDPAEDTALAARARLLLDLGDAEGAAATMGQRRDLHVGPERVAIDLELATLLFERLGRTEEALATVAPVIEATPGDPNALGLLKLALAKPETAQRAAELLERACDSVQDPQVAASILKVLLSTPANTPEIKAARRGWFERLLDRPDASPELALEVALQAVDELPGELSFWDRAETLASSLEKPDAIAKAYRRRLDAEADPATAAATRLDPDTLDEIARRAVDYYEEWFDEPETVVELLSRVVDVCPDAAWAFERLKLVYNEAERWSDLFALYDRAIARTTDKDALIELLEDASQSAKDLAGDADRAVGYLEQLLPLKHDARIRSSLERLYERLGRHRPLIHLLGMELPALGHEEALRMRARIAALWLDGVGDPDAAFAVIEAMLAADPARAEAFDLLERILVHTSAAKEASPDAAAAPAPASRKQAALLLDARYRAENRPADLVRMLDVELESADEPATRGALLREIVELRADVLNDPAAALESLAALVALEPADKRHREQLEQLAERIGRFDRLASVFVSVAERCKQKLKIELYFRAATIYRHKLGDADRAIELGRAILALNPKDSAVLLRAARELDELLAEQGRSAERCDVLERMASVETDAAARREVLLTVARLASSDLGDRPRAIAAYRARLSDEPKDLEALSGLIVELGEERRFAELAAALEDRSSQTDGDDARRDCVRVAELFDRELDDTARAITVWEGLRARFGTDDSSCDALAALLEKAERWTDLASLLEQSAHAADTESRRAELWRRLGDVQRDRTLEWAKAVKSYEASLSHSEALVDGAEGTDRTRAPLEGLENLLGRIDAGSDGDRPILSAAVGVLQRAYAESDDWQRMTELLEPRLIAAENDAVRTEILGQTAVLIEQRKGDASAAFDAVWRAFALIPNAAIAAEVLRLAGLADRWGHIAEAFSAIEARGEVPSAVARDLWWNVALWHRDRRGDAQAAETALEKALGYEPESSEMLSALVDIRRQSPGRPLVTSLLQLADATGGSLALYREATEAAMGPVADRSLAKSIAEKLLETAISAWSSSDDAQSAPARAASWALGVLTGICREEGDVARMIELCLRGARLPFDREERRALRTSAAEIAEPPLAITIYEELFEEDSSDNVVGERLETLYRDENRRADLLSLRGRQIDVCEDIDTRVNLRLDLALLLANEGAVDRAIRALRQGLSEVPTHPASVDKLAELLDAQGDHAALATLWETQAALREARGEDAAAAELWRRAATIAENRVNDIPRAIDDHRHAARFFDMTSLDALSRLFTDRGEHAAAAEVLETICARTPNDTSPHPALRLAEALVAAGQPATARERLEAAIAVVTDAAPLRARLSSLYREAELWGPLASLIALEASVASDPAVRISLLCEAAQLHLDKRSDPQAAVPLLEQASVLSPDDRVIKLSLCDALSSAGRAEEAMAILREIITSYGTRRPKERAIVHFHLARVAIAIGDRTQALAELDLALKIDPAHPEILHTLARLAFEEGQLDRAQRTYRALLLIIRRQRDDQTSLAASRSEVLLALSEIAERQGEPDRATEHVESAFEGARESAEECSRLIVALRSRGRREALARAIELRLQSPGPHTEMADYQSELAQVYEDEGRTADAFEARLRALSLAPTTLAHEAALDLARRTSQVDRYAQALSRLVEERGGDEHLIDLLLALGRVLATDLGDANAAISTYSRAESILEKSLTGEGGGAGEQAASSMSRMQEVWRALETAYGLMGDTDAQAKILEKRVAQAPLMGLPPADQADVLYRIAALRLAAPDGANAGADAIERALAISPDPERAEAIFRNALEVSPRNERLLRLFERFARESTLPRCLIDALVGLAAVSGDPGHLKEAFEIAAPLGDNALAESILRRVLAPSAGDDSGAADPPDIAWALIALSELREAAGDAAEAVSLKERAARIADPDHERPLLLGAAALAKGPLGDLARAVGLYERLREREPADREIWEPLAELYRRLGDSARLSALIDQTVPLIETVEERSSLRLERARLVMNESGGDAISLLFEILEEDPTHAEAAELLSGMLERAGRIDELVDLLGRQLDAAKDAENAAAVVAVSMRLGALNEQRGETQHAIDAYQGALDWDETNRGALRALLRLHPEDSHELGDALEKLIRLEEGDEAISLALRLVELRKAQGDDAGVEQALEVAYAKNPAHAGIRNQLVERYTASEAWQKLAEMQVLEAETRTDDAERAAALYKAAAILRERAGDDARAAEILQKALDLDPSQRDVLVALVDAYSAIGEHPKAVQAITAVLACTPEDAALYRARGAVYEAMQDDSSALADLEVAYDKSGGSYAAQLSEQLDRAVSRFAAAGDNSNERSARLRLSRVLIRAGEHDNARVHLDAIIDNDDHDREALGALIDLEEAQGEWAALSDAYRRLLQIEEGEAIATTAARLAAAYERAGDPAGAREGLELAFTAAPVESQPAIRQLLRAVYSASADNGALASLILEDAAAADADARLALILEASRLLVSADPLRASRVLEEARVAYPDEQEPTLLLADAYAATGRMDDARGLLTDQLAAQKGRRSKALALVYQRLARIEDVVGNRAEALSALSKAVENDPHNGPLAMELSELAIQMNEHDIATKSLRAVTLMKIAAPGAADGTTPPLRGLAFHHLGQMAMSTGDRRKARLMFEKALSEDPNLEEARALLEEVRNG